MKNLKNKILSYFKIRHFIFKLFVKHLKRKFWRRQKPIVYFETSALNYLAAVENQTQWGGRAFTYKNFPVEFRTSSISLWEVMVTSNSLNREVLILTLQTQFPFKLLPSPEELIISYVELGCPLVEKRRELRSSSPLAKVWEDLIQDERRTFVLDRDELLSKIKLVRDLGKSLRNFVTGTIVKDDVFSDPTLRLLFDLYLGKISIFQNYAEFSNEDKTLYRTAMFYIFIIFCSGVTLEPEPIDSFWIKTNMPHKSPIERLDYLISKYEELVYRGPFLTMAMMTITQLERPHSRGLWMDCLHSTYLAYSDQFLTTDQHFHDLKNKNTIFSKIKNPEEIRFLFGGPY